MPEEQEQTPAPETEAEDTSQPTAASEEETPAQDSQESEPAVDFEQRYNDLRPEYDRSQQLLAAVQGRHGPEAQAQALEALGLEFEGEDDTPDDEFLDEEDRIARLEQAFMTDRQEREQQAQLAQEEEHILTALSEVESKEGVQLSDEEVQLIIGGAFTSPNEQGLPDIQGAYKALRAAEKAAQERYLNSKKAPKVAVGTAGEEKIDLNDDEARRDYMARVMAQEMGSD